MNQVPTTPTPKTSQSTLIIISILAGILILLAGFGAYIFAMNTQLSNSSVVKSSSSSMMSKATSSTISSTMMPVSSIATSTQASNLKTLSCPSFDISINTDKYKVGFDKFNKGFAVNDAALLESAKKEILETQSIKCLTPGDGEQGLVKFIEKNFELSCWNCGGGYIKSLNFNLLDKLQNNKIISTTTTKGINNIDATVKKMSYDNMENKPVNYNLITFKIKDVDYQISTEAGSEYPTDAENEALLKDALELFNSIKVK